MNNKFRTYYENDGFAHPDSSFRTNGGTVSNVNKKVNEPKNKFKIFVKRAVAVTLVTASIGTLCAISHNKGYNEGYETGKSDGIIQATTEYTVEQIDSEIAKIKDQINYIIENEYWVSHVTKGGETLLGYAYDAGADYNNAESLARKIASKNKELNPNNLNYLPVDIEIEIFNPELGPLYKQLYDLEDQKQDALSALNAMSRHK